jgi:ATP-binding cassette subfamily B protein
MPKFNKSSARPMGDVLAFLLREWRKHLALVGLTAGAMVAATLTDVFLPVYAGNLVTAVSDAGNDRDVAAHGAVIALVIMACLGLSQTVLRYVVFRSIVRLTLHNMKDVALGAAEDHPRHVGDRHAE